MSGRVRAGRCVAAHRGRASTWRRRRLAADHSTPSTRALSVISSVQSFRPKRDARPTDNRIIRPQSLAKKYCGYFATLDFVQVQRSSDSVENDPTELLFSH
ncbi:hypothetical protein AVEN_154274-1 [Araneus ventricosus]|uniref:Uncharacterized protein n=1 Tax=Araneus ventricosus TaxID=182803 RepID=A0A4Y2NAU2_ARAVE|nr:hypothetical protein AVEN_154274-1 [Araneus ventricosus]